MYNKLFAKIVRSSIWLEPTPTRLVWFMFIALMDEDGFVQFASVANVAHTARIPDKEAQEAINILEAPDQNSADDEHEGRRIERVPGGWMVLNASKYRDLVTRDMIRQKTRDRVAKHRAKKRGNASVTHSNDRVTQSDTDTRRKDIGANGSRTTSVEDWLRELEADKTYNGINVRQEYGKMLNWCRVNQKQPTKRRFVNWLNRSDAKLPTTHAARVDYQRSYVEPAPEISDEQFEAQRRAAKECFAALKKQLHPNSD